MPRRRDGLLLLLLLLSAGFWTPSAAAIDLDRVKRATVFIYQAKSIGNDLIIKCVSSGTLISADGLIITNAHSVLPRRQCDGDQLIISLNVDLAEQPIPKYRAEIFGADEGVDIAILRIARELDGRLIAEGELPILPFADIGDADAVLIDDNLIVAGFPDLGNRPVTTTRGTVTAFITEPTGPGPSWFKTRAEIPGTMSGGGAYNSRGQLIGIPTSAPLVGAAAAASCRYIADTDGDGLVNASDSCVPIGDFVSTVRPISHARGLIRGARNSLKVDVISAPALIPPPMNPPRVSRMFFAPSVVDGAPATVVGAMPNNTKSLFLFFDYDNMSAETVYELRVARDGIPDTTFSLPPVRWSGRESGVWHIGSREQAWANGAYEFTLLINGASVGSQRIVVGGAARNRPQFSDIVFGTLDSRGALTGNGSILPLGDIASARFLFANMRGGRPWTAIWYYGGVEVARSVDAWSDDAHGAKVIRVAPEGGLLPGQYRLELYIEGALSATSDFIVAGRPAGPLPEIFANLRHTSAESPLAASLAPAASSFPGGIPALYALFDWRLIAAGTPWTLRWLVDDQPFYQTTQPWLTIESGADFTLALANPPDGSYTLQLLVDNLKVAEQDAIVGIGQLPIDRLAQFEGTILSGRVIDSATGRGLPSVTIVLISADYTAEEFEWREDQIFALAATDRNGDFLFARPLAFDTYYSVVIEADGYIPHAADEFFFEPDQPYADIEIAMVRG